MVLVPEHVLNRHEQKQKLETTPIMANMMHQDTEMSEILQSASMPDAEKQKLYNANMESYLSLRRQKDGQIPTVRIAPDTEQEPEPIKKHVYLMQTWSSIYLEPCVQGLQHC